MALSSDQDPVSARGGPHHDHGTRSDGRGDTDRLADDLFAGLRPGPGSNPLEELLARLSDRLADAVARWRARRWAAIATLLAMAAAVAVGWWLLRPAAPPIEASIPRASLADPANAAGGGSAAGLGAEGGPPGTTSLPDADLVVQAAGAVAAPGVYRVRPDARVDDLVSQAGGLTADADVDRVNLAAPLSDGERIWIPRFGQQPPDVVAGGTGSSGLAEGSVAGGDDPPDVVDLNAASASALEALPGVGPATSSAILAYREEHGRFASVDELLEVRGIGDAKLEQIRPLVRV